MVGLQSGNPNANIRVVGSFPVANPEVPFVPQAAEEEEVAQPMPAKRRKTR